MLERFWRCRCLPMCWEKCSVKTCLIHCSPAPKETKRESGRVLLMGRKVVQDGGFSIMAEGGKEGGREDALIKI